MWAAKLHDNVNAQYHIALVHEEQQQHAVSHRKWRSASCLIVSGRRRHCAPCSVVCASVNGCMCAAPQLAIQELEQLKERVPLEASVIALSSFIILRRFE